MKSPAVFYYKEEFKGAGRSRNLGKPALQGSSGGTAPVLSAGLFSRRQATQNQRRGKPRLSGKKYSTVSPARVTAEAAVHTALTLIQPSAVSPSSNDPFSHGNPSSLSGSVFICTKKQKSVYSRLQAGQFPHSLPSPLCCIVLANTKRTVLNH